MKKAKIVPNKAMTINDIIMSYGIQKGPRMVYLALNSLKRVRFYNSALGEFPAELEDHRQWMSELTIQEAENLDNYATAAASLAFRHARKRVVADRKKR